MDRPDALELLPVPYRIALKLRDAGVEAGLIAEATGVEPDAIDAFIEVGQAKLAALLGMPKPDA